MINAYQTPNTVGITFWLFVLPGLYIISLYNYLLFHSLAEIFSIVVAAAIFVISWNSRRFLHNSYFLILGIAFLFVAGLDLLHTLAYSGMGVFPGYGTNLPTQLWISARYMEAASFLIAPLFFPREVKAHIVFMSYGICLALILGGIFYWHIFPDCFVEGAGLTPFKRISEYIISFLFSGAIVLLLQNRQRFEKEVLHLLIASLLLTICSELSFTLYTHAYGLLNLIGHYFKVISFYLIYRALIHTGLVKPYSLLFRELKQSEEALKKSQAVYRAVVEDQSELICRFTADNTLTFVNNSFCQYFEKRRSELIGQQFSLYIYKEDRKRLALDLASFSPKGCITTREYRVLAPDGEMRTQQWTFRAIYDKPGLVIEFQAVGRDITDQKRMEEALRKSEEKYRAMMESINDPIFICSPDFRVQYMNPAMIKRVGGDFLGEPCHNVINALDEKCPWCVYDKVKKGQRHRMELQSPKDGRFYYVSHYPIYNADGSTSKMSIYRDITELRLAEKALQESHDALEKKVEERTQELSNTNLRLRKQIAERKLVEDALKNSESELKRISSQLLRAQEEERRRIAMDLHDGIGQSLSAIKFRIETALQEMEGEALERGKKSLAPVIPVIQNAVDDVRRILMDLRPSILDDLGILATISWLCREVEKTYPGIHIQKAFHIQEEAVPQSLKIIIYRILQEAINNITKHSRADHVRVGLHEKDGRIELCVSDNGNGFNLESVRFQIQHDKGLGISSMKERSQLSGGTFSIESMQGQGTTIRSSWPLREKPLINSHTTGS